MARIALIAAAGALAGCGAEETFNPKEKWNYLVCTLKDRPQPEHIAFVIRDDGKAVAAYEKKVVKATITPFEIAFDHYDGLSRRWRISRTDGSAEMTYHDRIYRGMCVKAEGAKL
jgi:hypothetical protein